MISMRPSVQDALDLTRKGSIIAAKMGPAPGRCLRFSLSISMFSKTTDAKAGKEAACHHVHHHDHHDHYCTNMLLPIVTTMLQVTARIVACTLPNRTPENRLRIGSEGCCKRHEELLSLTPRVS